ncbi:UNVERIFIED_CONTAM: hypothetical protein PYX00_001756 [Menopon gallinae]|uniref:Ku domain-containing protein n=1 Tax=Menopon gallinae TaxID=328185 RepID=A0AAW2IDT1_9NEOP
MISSQSINIHNMEITDSSSSDEELGNDADNDGNDKRREKRDYEITRSADIYLIDARKEMFSQNCLIEDTIPIIQSLKSIRHAMRKKIWNLDNSLCAIILLGIKTDNPINLKGINVVQPLTFLRADHILKCDELIKKIEESSFEQEYGSSDFSLADAFWLSCKLFLDCAKNLKLNKTIVLFTNDDDPTKKDRNEFDRIISTGQDMLQYHILLNLINLGENFNVGYLFKELIQLSSGDMDYQIPDPPKTLQEIINQISKVHYSKLKFATLPFYITDKFKCMVSVYYLVKKVKPPFKVKLSKATNAYVITRMKYFETETGEVVKKENLITCYTLAGREVAFTMDERLQMKRFIRKELRLMGFKPASTVNLEHYLKPSVFIFPSVDDLDTCTFFMALHRRCMQRQIVPICTFCQRHSTEMHYVALIARPEETDEDNRTLCPPGFHVFFLPAAEDVRDLDEVCAEKNRANPEQVEAAKKLIKKLKFKYKPDMFTNPKLAAHWSAVEALALNLKEPEPFVDTTMPDYDLIKERTKSVAERFASLVFPENYDPETEPKKASAPRSKQTRPQPEVDVEQVESYLKSGQFQRLTNDILKLYLKKVGQGKDISKEKKANLIERACRHLGIPPP